ncbi:retrotransposon protein putative Ty3-gypsy subclass, partial [Trifolium medium]|nr:retrotransposon protein putative Ty3-gypsy subclass [Trifolium medium]
MRLNPEKCTFGIKAGKFLGFYLTERGIEANPDKCDAIIQMETPSSKEWDDHDTQQIHLTFCPTRSSI